MTVAVEDARAEGREEGKAEGREEGKAEGEIKGKAEGIAEGEARKARETALSMLSDGMPIETISKYTGLPVEEIRRISSKK
jgi:predicted transposase YdaD